MAGYFDNEFKILPGSYIDPVSMRRRARMEEKKKNIVTRPFVSMYRARDPYVNFLLMVKVDRRRRVSEKVLAHSMAP